MKRSTGILVLLLLAFAMGTLYLLNRGKQVNTGTDFAFEKSNSIHKMILSHPNGTNIQLRREGKRWLVGDKPARQEAVDLLLETLRRLHIRSRVPKAAESNVKKSLKELGITLKAYDRSGDLLKTWTVGTGSQGNLGTYMMLGGASVPFEVDIMGWEGQLRPRFIIEEEAWRDRTVFGYKPKEIKSVAVQYFEEKNKTLSFKIDRVSKKEYTVAPLNAEAKPLENPIQAKVMHYLKGYESIVAENYVNELPVRDSILQTTPFCEIRIEDEKGGSKKVKLFPIPTEGESISASGDVVRNEIERYHASIDDNKDFMLVQHRVFVKLLPPYAYFFEK